jgi:hypothetical protein
LALCVHRGSIPGAPVAVGMVSIVAIFHLSARLFSPFRAAPLSLRQFGEYHRSTPRIVG